MANLNDNVSAAFKKAQQQAVYAGGHMEGVTIFQWIRQDY